MSIPPPTQTTAPVLLNQPEDLKAAAKALRSKRIGEVKACLAWWDGHTLRYSDSVAALGQLPPFPKITQQLSWETGLQYQTVLFPQMPKVAKWCLTLNQGDGFRALPDEALRIEYELRDWLRLNAPECDSTRGQAYDAQSPQDHVNWINNKFTLLCESCEVIAHVDAEFMTIWETHKEDIQKGGWKAMQMPHPPSIKVACDAFHALGLARYYLTKRFSECLESAKSQNLLLVFRPLLFRLTEASFLAGERVKALATIAANYKTLSTLGALKCNSRGEDGRTKLIRRVDLELTARKGKKPSALEVMKALDGHEDPKSKQKIHFVTEEDGVRFVQWEDHYKQKESLFRTKLSTVRSTSGKKGKNNH